jgi:pyridoxamine 5'-phosphate oxidase
VTEPTDLTRLRSEYQARGLVRSDLPTEPLELWRQWLADAQAAGLPESNAMVVSTVDPDGAPSSRTVLCKDADHQGFVFFTNYHSRKGLALANEARISLLFPWHSLARQVIVSGVAAPVSRAESEAYFATRSRTAQLSASASEQSTVVASREVLEQRVSELDAQYEGAAVPCPPHWGGYRVQPASIEFWQGRAGRLHDRLRYRVSGEEWVVERLSP